MACLQSMQAMIGLIDNLTKQHSYLYILLAKFHQILSKEDLGGIVKPMEAILYAYQLAVPSREKNSMYQFIKTRCFTSNC